MARSDLADSCWNGCAGRRTLPANIIYTGDDSLRADYECGHCGATWWTGWGATGAGWPTLLPCEVDPSRPVLADLTDYGDEEDAA
jgi:hypothetical protein